MLYNRAATIDAEAKSLAFITTSEAATKLGVNQSRVRQLILSGQLFAQKFGRDWLIEQAELERFLTERRGVGRPKEKDEG